MSFLKPILFVFLFAGMNLFSGQACAAEDNKQIGVSATPKKIEKSNKLYRIVDKNGNVSYSDVPSTGAKEIRLPPAATIKIMTPKIEFESEEEQENRQRDPNASSYDVMAYVNLSDNGVVRNNASSVTFSVKFSPTLSKGHYIKFFIDGKLIKGQQKEHTITAEKVTYGEHTARFSVVSQNGAEVQRSSSVKFNLLHIVRKKTRGGGLASNKFIKVNYPQTPKLPTYESMRKKDNTDK